MVRQHHGLNGHESEQTPGDSEGQGSLVCCSPWGHDLVTEQKNLCSIWIDYDILMAACCDWDDRCPSGVSTIGRGHQCGPHC